MARLPHRCVMISVCLAGALLLLPLCLGECVSVCVRERARLRLIMALMGELAMCECLEWGTDLVWDKVPKMLLGDIIKKYLHLKRCLHVLLYLRLRTLYKVGACSCFWYISPRNVNLLTFVLFQTCMTLFPLWNTKEDILKNVWTVWIVHIMKVNGVQKNTGPRLLSLCWQKPTETFFRTYPLCSKERKKERRAEFVYFCWCKIMHSW